METLQFAVEAISNPAVMTFEAVSSLRQITISDIYHILQQISDSELELFARYIRSGEVYHVAVARSVNSTLYYDTYHVVVALLYYVAVTRDFVAEKETSLHSTEFPASTSGLKSGMR